MLITEIISRALLYTCVVDRFCKSSNWTLFWTVPCWIVCKVLYRSIRTRINALVCCNVSILLTRAIFNTFKCYSITPCIVNFCWANSNATSWNIICKVIDSCNYLTHSNAFSNCGICWMLKSIISLRTYRNASPCRIICIENYIFSSI